MASEKIFQVEGVLIKCDKSFLKKAAISFPLYNNLATFRFLLLYFNNALVIRVKSHASEKFYKNLPFKRDKALLDRMAMFFQKHFLTSFITF